MAVPNLYANQQQWAKMSKEYGEVKQLLTIENALLSLSTDIRSYQHCLPV
jgi:hypothetical protein